MTTKTLEERAHDGGRAGAREFCISIFQHLQKAKGGGVSDKDLRLILQNQGAIMLALKGLIEAMFPRENLWRTLHAGPLETCIKQSGSRVQAICRRKRLKNNQRRKGGK